MPKNICFIGKTPSAAQFYDRFRYVLQRQEGEYTVHKSNEISQECKSADAVFFVDENSDAIASFLNLYAKVSIFPEYTIISDIANNDIKYGYRIGKAGREIFETDRYAELGIERVARIAFEFAEKHRKAILSVDRADQSYTGKYLKNILNK